MAFDTSSSSPTPLPAFALLLLFLTRNQQRVPTGTSLILGIGNSRTIDRAWKLTLPLPHDGLLPPEQRPLTVEKVKVVMFSPPLFSGTGTVFSTYSAEQLYWPKIAQYLEYLEFRKFFFLLELIFFQLCPRFQSKEKVSLQFTDVCRYTF